MRSITTRRATLVFAGLVTGAVLLSGCANQAAPGAAFPAAPPASAAPPIVPKALAATPTLGTTAPTPANWTTITDPTNGVVMTLPGSITQVTVAGALQYRGSTPTGGALVSLTSAPANQQATPTAVIGATVNTTKGKLVNFYPDVTVGRYHAVDARIDTDTGSVTGEGISWMRVITTPSLLVTVITVTTGHDEAAAEALHQQAFAGVVMP